MVKVRCEWAVRHPELLDYHDQVWGVPTHDDRDIFAAYGQCVLHAGLLWTAMLKKRALFARAFDDWDMEVIARYDGADVDRLVHTEGMIRNFVKIHSVITNARRALDLQVETGSLASFFWGQAPGAPIAGTDPRGRAAAEWLSRELRARGWKFAGPATAYGVMQDTGIINPHHRACYRSLEA